MKKLLNVKTNIGTTTLEAIEAYEFNAFNFDGHKLPNNDVDYTMVGMNNYERLRC